MDLVTLSKGDKTRIASTPTARVQLEHEGWMVVGPYEPKAPPATPVTNKVDLNKVD